MSSQAGKRKSAHTRVGFATGMEAVRTYTQVRDAWNQQSGQSISRARIYQILVSAQKKLKDGLRRTAAEYFDDPSLLEE